MQPKKKSQLAFLYKRFKSENNNIDYTMRRNGVIILALLLLALPVKSQQNVSGIKETFVIEGTDMSRLQSAMDVMHQIPGIVISEDAIIVPGRGNAAIYINNRKVTELSELWHLNASRIKEVYLIRQPGADYGKDVQAVVIIKAKKSESEGLGLDYKSRIDLTHKLSTGNELTLRWSNDRWALGGFVGWNEERNTFHKDNFTRKYLNGQLISEKQDVIHPHNSVQQLTVRAKAAYDINDNHNISVRYSLADKQRNTTHIPEFPQRKTHPDQRHDIAVEYAGHIGDLSITVGNNTFFSNADLTMYKTDRESYYLRDEYDLRTYAKAEAPIWKGIFSVGAEHEYDHMEVNKHDDLHNPPTEIQSYYGIHAMHPDNTLAFYASSKQKFGELEIEAGLRYEHTESEYQPCSDDGLLRYIKDNLTTSITDGGIIDKLYKNGELSTHRDFLYPSVKLSAPIGNTQLSLVHTRSSVRPYLGLTRLEVADAELMQEKILWTEKIATTSLQLRYKWLNLRTTHTRYTDPICTTLSSMVSYNAPDYDAADIHLTLTPHIGIWTPYLYARFHKQWFTMPLANGQDKLKKPLIMVSFNNSLSLPHNWMILINSDWHSKGADRNNYYYDTNLKLDAMVQKEFPRQRLTVSLGATNILKSSNKDITRYVKAFYGISEGTCEYMPRTVSLAVRYKM